MGRVGISLAALPAVYPVNYWFDGESIFIRTDGDSVLADLALKDEVIAFEVDEIDPFEHSGWSVLATGRVRDVDSDDITSGLDPSMIPRFAPGGENVIAITPAFLSGRRVGPAVHAPPAGRQTR